MVQGQRLRGGGAVREVIPLAVPNLSGNEGKYLRECIETNFVSSAGPFVEKFEEMVARAAGTACAVAVSSGTTGLHLALHSLGVKAGDLVVLPSFTFIASANAIAHCGAAPWVLDIDPAGWTLDPRLLEKELAGRTRRAGEDLVHTPTGRRVAAVMPVYTLGSPADMQPILELARSYGLPVVADAAAALGASYRKGPLGELADLTVFSFNGNKTITAGGGGMIAGTDEKLLRQVRHLSTQARPGREYHHDQVGFNYRLTNLQAAVGCAQMERLEELVRRKRQIQAAYESAFAGLPGIGLFPKPPWGESACWLAGITVEDPGLPPVKNICERLRDKGIQTRTFWKPVHLQPPYRDAPRSGQPVSEKIWDKVLTLPCSTSLTAEQQGCVIETVSGLLR
ncbi:MAG: aminotransferase class I/II-fold pyridoxal phosphate-dependent enzyme [Candidatus Glassbacteria bacterium]|nr:aminotransferase class I/II-fold pyridoxal phosphate-dependent enzyme [Candidatus Glassbacteria bacterium]